VLDHDARQVLDPLGRQDATTDIQQFTSSTLNILVARSYCRLVFWDQISMQLKKIDELFVEYTDGLNIFSLQPLQLRQANQFLSVLLENAAGVIISDIENYSASPELRSHFTRTATIDKRASLHEDPVRARVYMMLQEIVGHYKKKEWGFSGIRFRLDLLDSYLRKNGDGWNWISLLVRQALTKLSVLVECHLVFELQSSRGTRKRSGI
jgi:hypothetical protein